MEHGRLALISNFHCNTHLHTTQVSHICIPSHIKIHKFLFDLVKVAGYFGAPFISLEMISNNCLFLSGAGTLLEMLCKHPKTSKQLELEL